jgi:signal transduction histidine kinase
VEEKGKFKVKGKGGMRSYCVTYIKICIIELDWDFIRMNGYMSVLHTVCECSKQEREKDDEV